MKRYERDYTVTIRFQFPAWDERDGISYTVPATSKAEAIARARLVAHRDGHIPATGKGRTTLVAQSAT